MSECYVNLHAFLKSLSESDLYLNKNKCSFFSDKIQYYGHVVQFNEISKSPKEVERVQKMPLPANVEELGRFLIM
ncbi:hypothetical protein HHI36_014280, partial [Cryptolaemus montrouzieri]